MRRIGQCLLAPAIEFERLDFELLLSGRPKSVCGILPRSGFSSDWKAKDCARPRAAAESEDGAIGKSGCLTRARQRSATWRCGEIAMTKGGLCRVHDDD